MAQYQYKALDAQGKPTSGRIEAENAKDAALRLRQQSIFVLEISESSVRSEANDSRIRQGLGGLNPKRWLPVMAGDLVIFFRQFSLMLRAGYTVLQALNAAKTMQSKTRLIRAIDQMGERIKSGSSLSASMSVDKRLFSPLMVNLVAIGERSGNLDAILIRLAENLERTKELKRQLLSALFYPMIVLMTSIVVVSGLVIWVIPRFATFLEVRNVALPRSTQMLLDVGDWTLHYGKILGPLIGVLIFLLFAAYTFEAGKQVIDRVFLNLPLVGTAIQYSAMAQAGWSLSLLLRSGLPALDSLRINGKAAGNLAIRDSFVKAADELLVGRALSRSFEQPHFPLMMRHMAAVGEKSGELDVVMEDVGQYYQSELAAKVKLMSAMIEPVLILIVGGLVGFVYFSMFQAVMSVSKGGM
ncbi:type II secretion system F family protein [Cerasicoccus maritimus]|uniref:type II secretion system F family protein n=1 Tax=Cerasicoccus maritimus TaxID=490089 RepID=UPI0028525339|nr:type II secretion system F family protein [Cerasicoccus maritimus]